jgi:hypothetical protein
MVAREGSDPHRGGKLPSISETDFPTWEMLFNASLMRHIEVQEAFEIEVHEDETQEDKELRIETYEKGNRKAYSYLSDAYMENKTAVLIMRNKSYFKRQRNLGEFHYEITQIKILKTCRGCIAKVN